MSFALFPAEILDNICLHLPDTDLVSIASVNTTFTTISQRILYRHIVSSVLTDADPGVVKTLASRPDISQYVRSFSLTFRGDHAFQFHPYLSSALASMTGLESLDLLIGSDNSSVLRSCCNYLRLRHFSCSFAFDQNLADFLQRTPNIVELELHSASASESSSVVLSSTCIPRLAHFLGPSCVAELVVPGRPVQALFLSSGLLTESILSQLVRSTSPVVLLDAILNTELITCLDAIARYLPSLSYLRLMSVLPFDGHPDTAFFDHVAKILHKMPDLTSFEFSGMNWSSFTHTNSLSGGKRFWQLRPPSPTFPSLDMRSEDLDDFSEYSLAF